MLFPSLRSLLTVRCAMMCVLLLAMCLPASGKREVRRHSKMLEDIFTLSDTVNKRSWHYTGEYYYRCALTLKQKNAIIVSTPNRRFYLKDGKDLLTEDIGDMEYYPPGVFMRKARHTYGAVQGYDVAHGYIMDFFNLDVHGSYLFGDHVLSPLRRHNAYYYKYRCDSVKGNIIYFSFKRKRRNMQLVDGSFVYNQSTHHIMSITIRGRYNFISFEETVTMGTEGWERYWPVKAELSFDYWYYGNVFKGKATYTQQYDNLDGDFKPKRSAHDHYDITAHYALALDTARSVRDSAYIAENRTVPLTDEDKRFYSEARERTSKYPRDTAENKRSSTPKWIKQLGTVGEFFFNDYDIMTTKYTTLKVLSPYLGYSGSRGVSYRQDLEYVKTMPDGKWWSVVPRVGYYFKTSELTGRLKSELMFHPRHNGKIIFEAGLQNITANSNNLYFMKDNGKGEDEVESLEFADFYTHIDGSRELFNGFELSAGILMHHRKPRNYAKDHSTELGLRSRYRDFAPRMTITYTPKQHYYRIGDRKVTVGSTWPTFVGYYERGMKGVMGSTNDYEKWEFTVSQGFHFTPLHRLIWKVGGGMFTAKESSDFMQYEYFNNGITAYNWDDDRSGVFQLLDQKYYNNSKHYLRGHVVVESPMIVLGNFSTRVVRCERIYVNALVTEGLVPYFEFGYGVSNELLDISVFTSYLKDESLKTGIKFNLHIFD